MPCFLAYRLDKAVVVGVFKAGLQGVVVDIGHGPLGFDTRNAHGLKLQISHRAGGVLRQGLVDSQSDFRSYGHLTA